MEEGEAGMRACKAIPTRIASGIDNAYFDKVVESRSTTSVEPCGCRHLGYELVKRHENGRARESEVFRQARIFATASFRPLMTMPNLPRG